MSWKRERKRKIERLEKLDPLHREPDIMDGFGGGAKIRGVPREEITAEAFDAAVKASLSTRLDAPMPLVASRKMVDMAEKLYKLEAKPEFKWHTADLVPKSGYPTYAEDSSLRPAEEKKGTDCHVVTADDAMVLFSLVVDQTLTEDQRQVVARLAKQLGYEDFLYADDDDDGTWVHIHPTFGIAVIPGREGVLFSEAGGIRNFAAMKKAKLYSIFKEIYGVDAGMAWKRTPTQEELVSDLRTISELILKERRDVEAEASF